MPTPRTKEDEFIRCIKLIKEHLEDEGWDLKNSDYEIGHLAVILRDEIQKAREEALQSRDDEIREFCISNSYEYEIDKEEGITIDAIVTNKILHFLNNRA